MDDNQQSVIIWEGEGVVPPRLLTVWVIVSLNCILDAAATFPASSILSSSQPKLITRLETGSEEFCRGICFWFLSTWLMKILNYISKSGPNFTRYYLSSKSQRNSVTYFLKGCKERDRGVAGWLLSIVIMTILYGIGEADGDFTPG